MLRVELLARLFVDHFDRVNRAGFRRGHNRIRSRAYRIDNDGRIGFVELKHGRRAIDTIARSNTPQSIHNDA